MVGNIGKFYEYIFFDLCYVRVLDLFSQYVINTIRFYKSIFRSLGSILFFTNFLSYVLNELITLELLKWNKSGGTTKIPKYGKKVPKIMNVNFFLFN